LATGLDYDHRCDVWSLGCVLYELVELGRRAFAGDHTGTDRAIINGRYEPVRRAAYGPAIAVFLQTGKKETNKTRIFHRFNDLCI
jgi:serine/threonine protein kinase